MYFEDMLFTFVNILYFQIEFWVGKRTNYYKSDITSITAHLLIEFDIRRNVRIDNTFQRL